MKGVDYTKTLLLTMQNLSKIKLAYSGQERSGGQGGMPIARSAATHISFEDLDISRLLNALDALAIGSRTSGDE